VIQDPGFFTTVILAAGFGGSAVITSSLFGSEGGHSGRSDSILLFLYLVRFAILAFGLVIITGYPFIKTNRIASTLRNGILARGRVLRIFQRKEKAFLLISSGEPDWEVRVQMEAVYPSGFFTANHTITEPWARDLKEGDLLSLLIHPCRGEIAWVLAPEPVEQPEECNCMECGAAMPDGVDTCEKCGWTYGDADAEETSSV